MRRLFRTGWVLLLVGLMAIASRSVSESRIPTPPRTRIRLLNLAHLFKGYQKVIHYHAQNKKLLQPFADKAQDIKEHIETLTKELDNPELAEAQRAEYEKKRKQYHRHMEEVEHEAKTLLTKKNEEQMVIVYKELTEATERYARTHELDLVMHYSDTAPEDPEFFGPANVNRKIQARGLVPVAAAPGMDITRHILAELNDRYHGEK